MKKTIIAFFLITVFIANIVFVRTRTPDLAFGEVVMQEGIASWYSKKDPTDHWIHKTTASGEPFDENKLTCAMPSKDFGKYYKVTNLSNGKSVIVKHNDYNPFKRYKGRDISDRIIDLSKAAFSKIAPLRQGLVMVRVEEIKRGPTLSISK